MNILGFLIQTKQEPNSLFQAILEQVHHLPQHTDANKLWRQTGFYMLKRPHIFYWRIVDQLMQDNKSYESFITNVINGSCWGDWICAAAISDNWNVPISVVTPAWHSIVLLFHKCEKVEIILIANGWPESGLKLTHYSTTQCDDEDRFLLKNFGTEHAKKIPFKFLDPHKVQEEASTMVIEWQKSMLCTINIMEHRKKLP